MTKVLVLLSLIACSLSIAPWPQNRHDAQHTSFVDDAIASNFGCKMNAWKRDEQAISLVVNEKGLFHNFNGLILRILCG